MSLTATPSGTAAVTITSSTSSTPFTAPNRPPESPFSSPSASSTQAVSNGPIPSSAASSLYLYTFLATLVLLLSVSGAVVIRSLMMRARQRRAIEEAIRNGTYVPPDQIQRRQPAVKPTLFDAHLDGVDDVEGGEKGWSKIVPVAAQFIPSSQPSLPAPATAQTTSQAQRSLFSRFRLPNILGTLILPDRPRQAGPEGPTQMELAEAAFAQNAHDSGARPASVRMAFLIAMPDPAHPHPHPYPAPRSSSFSSGRPSTSSEKGKERDSSSSAFMHRTIDEEPELPYLEFGIADVPVRASRGDTAAREVASGAEGDGEEGKAKRADGNEGPLSSVRKS